MYVSSASLQRQLPKIVVVRLSALTAYAAGLIDDPFIMLAFVLEFRRLATQ